MSDQQAPSQTAPPAAEQGQQPAAQSDADKKAENSNNTAEGASQPRPPNQLLSHYKGMPRQWEKNKDKFPPKDE